MSKISETSFRRRVREWLKEQTYASEGKVKFYPIQQKSFVGDPDFIVCWHGIFVSLELKKNKNARRGKLQIHHLTTTLKAGGEAFFVYPENFETVKTLLLNIKPREGIS